MRAAQTPAERVRDGIWRQRDATSIAVALSVAGFILRAAFYLYGAQSYLGRANVNVDGDTGAWTASFVNLLETGVYTVDPAHESGVFGRLPAYSFVIGAFYLATGGDTATAYRALGWFQMVADASCVYLLFRVGVAALGRAQPALALAALYATYPFAMVWTPVIMSEALGVDVMIASLYCFVRKDHWRWAGGSGALIGVAVLLRPQLIILAALMAVRILLDGRSRVHLARLATFLIALLLTYGPWPIRNYVNHGRLVLTQDLGGFRNWAPDVISFMQYIYSVKAEWEPQFTQMVRSQPVVFPSASYTLPGDRAKLEEAVALAQTCGSGFTHWGQSVRPPLKGPNCDHEIARLFGELRHNQYRRNRWNAYVKVPLQNLRKAVFKRNLVEELSRARRLAAYLFLYRTLLIIVGLVAAVVLLRSGTDRTGVIWLAFLFFLTWYPLLCAGTLPQLRNIEMRYFLPTDVLLLVPGAQGLAWLANRVLPPG